jgi:serine acetyltransferase
MLMEHVNIGSGAIIAARSHVVRDVPPYAIVGGNPAKVIRLRFPQEQIDQLMKIKWWNWPDEKIKENIPLIMSPNLDEFITKHMVN